MAGRKVGNRRIKNKKVGNSRPNDGGNLFKMGDELMGEKRIEPKGKPVNIFNLGDEELFKTKF